jgi:hypothetical protein
LATPNYGYEKRQKELAKKKKKEEKLKHKAERKHADGTDDTSQDPLGQSDAADGAEPSAQPPASA